MKSAAVVLFVLAFVVLSGCGASANGQAAVEEPVSPAAEPAPAETPEPPAPVAAEEDPKPGTEAREEPAPALPALYDFWAEWCPPCRQQKPIVEQLREEYAGRVDVVLVNVDEQGELAERYGIQAIPTLVLFDAAGNEVERLTGLTSKEKLVERFRAHGFIE